MPSPIEQTIHSFLTTLFGENEGQVYVPTKGASAKSWVQHFFSYPARKDDIVAHMLEANKAGKDVYIAPALFKSNENATKNNWLGTQYIFVDFDGSVPSELPIGVPEPTMKVRSSVAGREHWYWKLDKFYTGHENRRAIESIAQNVTYAFAEINGDTDKSGWDSTQVLRAPGTKHRRSGATTSLLNVESSRVYSPGDFGSILPAPTKSIRLKTEEKNLPDVLQVLARVTLSEEAREIFNRDRNFMEMVNPDTGKKHDRSKALFKFARECLEIRPKVERDDILALLNHLAYKWGKFEDRSDRFVQIKIVLQNAIALAPQKRVDDEVDEEFIDLRFLSVDEMFAREAIPFDWIYNDHLAKGTLNVIASLGGVGKTSLMMQMCMEMATKKAHLGKTYGLENPTRSVLFSFEMPEQVFNLYTKNLLTSFTADGERELIEQNWKRSGLGYPVQLWNKKVQDFMAQQIDLHNSEVIVIDSVKYAGGMDEKHGDMLFEWVKKELIAKRGLTVYFIHHIRKPSSERPNHEPTGLEDLYGDVYIGNIADSVSFLYRPPNGTGGVKYIPVKTRTHAMGNPVMLSRPIDGQMYFMSSEMDESPVAESKENGNDSGLFA